MGEPRLTDRLAIAGNVNEKPRGLAAAGRRDRAGSCIAASFWSKEGGLYGSSNDSTKVGRRTGGVGETQGSWQAEADEAGTAPTFGSWEWTLNWDYITPNIMVGSCPRSSADIDRLVDEGGVQAILNLQSDLCFEALEIPYQSIRSRAVERGVLLHRVPTRDFDRGDQAMMLPEAVRTINMLVSRGFKVYVHCTAGINRATLAVVGYLTFVQGMTVDEAVKVVRTARSVAHPYIECWQKVHDHILDGRQEELTFISKEIYQGRCAGGVHGNSKTDWGAAQQVAISRTFARYLEIDMGKVQLELDIAETAYTSNKQQSPPPATNGSAATVAGQNLGEALETEAAEECNVITRECTSSDPEEVEDQQEVGTTISQGAPVNGSSIGNGAPGGESSSADPLEAYCAGNPETPECRVYED
eukprot:SM000017S02744  [mRNA]  locus=s17:173:3853:+ [translate_table: standard]